MSWAQQALRLRWAHIETLGEFVEHIEALGLDKDQEILGIYEHGSLLLSSEERVEFDHARQYIRENAKWAREVLRHRFEDLNCSNYWDLLHHFGSTIQGTPEIREALGYVLDSTRPL